MDEGRARRRGVSPRLWLAGGWLLLALLAAIFGPLVAPQDPLAQDLMLERLPPFWMNGAEPGYWLGTDSLGRDLLSRLIFGGRIAFIVAFAAAIAACVVGSTLGLIAGYFGGWADRIISRIVDVWMAFPPVLFAILLVAVLGTGLSSVILAIAIIDWTRFCRVIRAETMGQSRMDYVENARIAGYGRIGIMLREVLPNVVPSIVALLSLEMGIAVIVEAILSFVNLSISTDDPTWGGIIAEGRLSIHQAWWVLVFPLITLILTVLSFSQFGEALKTRFDPVLR
ncbi:MAG: ABC transporter permease [Mesorhizobium sp.]|uniref:ABC transporter permease n=1 Tax=unclassified Mesorhizobium TaxID=325217 RepID=UPI000FD463F3|nr:MULTISPECIES: ABC transporter permease [unclassified Mesorhizobium]AZV18169.1 ABC transporter permease [Mesorhizobium sp. M7A.F.Ce.TU.012.03.2.1]RUU93653.1 ABC transporter permease [Mesorhizobium sp. M7A.F.Ca.MR.176.00.0.0]RVD12665.1 ABC transporter permease [Mesorhizobium sp. M7A.F.Ca.ET.027.02.1.1]RWB09684.1 MAG: ABC transporter permease [Mesorhizobium sp.]RWB14785.1 MAG: ABC transporter permease [Mesorhizobium sp.]